jgi:hypothetical protein
MFENAFNLFKVNIGIYFYGSNFQQSLIEQNFAINSKFLVLVVNCFIEQDPGSLKMGTLPCRIDYQQVHENHNT